MLLIIIVWIVYTMMQGVCHFNLGQRHDEFRVLPHIHGRQQELKVVWVGRISTSSGARVELSAFSSIFAFGITKIPSYQTVTVAMLWRALAV
jgi:hypothetical protein